jgi:periplasmic protein CpxP/Spy
MKVMMAVRMAVAIAALATVGIAAGAQAPSTPPSGGGFGFDGHRPPMERALGFGGRFWNNPNIVAKLGLTDDQRKAMDDIFLQHRETLIDLRASLEKAELALEPLMKADQPDEGKITAQIDQIAQARAELEKANARFLLAIRAKLTPEQWKQVQEFRASHQGPMRLWRQGGQAPQPPPPDSPQ